MPDIKTTDELLRVTLLKAPAPEMQKLLALSTSHAPSAREIREIDATCSGDYGALVFIGERPAYDFWPDWMQEIADYARRLGADYVLLDADAPRAPYLTVWDW